MIEIFFDGACEPINPGGTASYGWLIKENGKIIVSGSGIHGKGDGMTNNVAEYIGIIEGIKAFKKLNLNDKVIICGDSNMVCNMVSKKWGWKNKKWNPHPKFPHLKKLLEEIHTLLANIEHEVKWIPRESNFEADALSKKYLSDLPKGEQTVELCQQCDNEMVKRKGKYGEFGGCSTYPKCSYTKK